MILTRFRLDSLKIYFLKQKRSPIYIFKHGLRKPGKYQIFDFISVQLSNQALNSSENRINLFLLSLLL